MNKEYVKQNDIMPQLWKESLEKKDSQRQIKMTDSKWIQPLFPNSCYI